MVNSMTLDPIVFFPFRFSLFLAPCLPFQNFPFSLIQYFTLSVKIDKQQ